MAKKTQKKPASRSRAKPAQKATETAVTKSAGGIGIRAAFSQGQPGHWASDHRAEAAHYTSWNYIAIRAVAIQASQASVAVYHDQRSSTKKAIRKSIRAMVIRKMNATSDVTGDELPPDSPIMNLMNRPNPTQSGAAFRMEQVIQLLLTGTCLIWKVNNGAGRICERYVIPTAVAYPVEPSRDLPRGGWRVDPSMCRGWSRFASDADGFTELGGYMQAIGRTIPAENMQVIRNPHPIWKDDGYSAVAAGAMLIDSSDQVGTARFSSLRNGIDPSVAISPDKDVELTEEMVDAAINKIKQRYGGPENVGAVMVVPPGSKVEKLTTNPKEMEYIGAFIQLRDAVMALHGVPGIAAGITDGGSYAAFYASLKQFTMLTVQPTLDLMAEEDTEQIAPQFGEGLTVDITAAAIDDPDIRLKEEDLEERKLQTDIQAGAISVDEIRELRGRKAWGGVKGGFILSQQAQPAYQPLSYGQPDPMGKPADEASTGLPGVPMLGSSEPDATQQPTNGAQQVPQNLQAEVSTLNGAQITAAITVCQGVTDGTTADLVAIELLQALGIDEGKARRMVAASKKVKTDLEAQQPTVEPQLNGHSEKRLSNPTLVAATQGALSAARSDRDVGIILRGVRYP